MLAIRGQRADAFSNAKRPPRIQRQQHLPAALRLNAQQRQQVAQLKKRDRFDLDNRHRPTPVKPESAKNVLISAAVAVLGCSALSTSSPWSAYPSSSRPPGAGRQNYATGSLRALGSAQAPFREGDRDGNGQHDYAKTLAELRDADDSDQELAAGVKSGYRLVLTSRRANHLERAARPLDPEHSEPAFYTDQHGVIPDRTVGT